MPSNYVKLWGGASISHSIALSNRKKSGLAPSCGIYRELHFGVDQSRVHPASRPKPAGIGFTCDEGGESKVCSSSESVPSN